MAVVEVTEEDAEYLDQTHACQHREKFSRDKRGATERNEPASKGVRGAPPEIFKNLYCKWCNLSYS